MTTIGPDETPGTTPGDGADDLNQDFTLTAGDDVEVDDDDDDDDDDDAADDDVDDDDGGDGASEGNPA